MVYDPIVQGQWLASKPTTVQCSVGGVTQRLQGNDKTGEHTISSNGVAANSRQTRQVAAGLVKFTPSSSMEQQQQQQQHSSSSQNRFGPCNSFHTTNGSSNRSKGKSAYASAMQLFVGMQATFAVSAAWHLLMFFAATNTFCWLWMWFFTMQGPLLLLESRIRKAARAAGMHMPGMLAVPLNQLLLISMASPLLVAPVLEAGVWGGCVAQARMVTGVVMQALPVGV